LAYFGSLKPRHAGNALELRGVATLGICYLHKALQRRHDWELGYAAEGASELYVSGGRRFNLNAGSFWSVTAGTDHWLRQGSEARHHRLFVGLQLPLIVARHSEWNLRKLLREVVVLHEVYQFEQLFARIITEGATPSHYQAAGLRLGLDALLLEIARAGTDGNKRAANAAMHPAVSRALNLLQTRFRESWSLERLATESGISRAPFSSTVSPRGRHLDSQGLE